MDNQKLREDLEDIYSWSIKDFLALPLYFYYRISVYLSDNLKMVYLASFVLYLLFLPLSILIYITEILYLLYLRKVRRKEKNAVTEHIMNNYSDIEELLSFDLMSNYSASELVNLSNGRLLIVQEEEIRVLKANKEFKIEFSKVGLFLDNIEIIEEYNVSKEGLDLERKTYYGIETCMISEGKEKLILAFSESYPDFVDNILERDLEIVDRNEFESKTGLNSWGTGEKDKLANSLDNKLKALELESYIYFYCQCSEEAQKFVVLDGEYLMILNIEEENHVIGNIDYYYVKNLVQSYEDQYIIFNKRNDGSLAFKLCFTDIKVKKEFEDKLESELNSRDIYFYKGYWDSKENINEIKKADLGLKKNFQNYKPYEFEEFIKELFEEKGYNSKLTKKSSDYGIDVIAEKEDEKIAIQVKRYQKSNKVGSPAVRRTLGSKHKINADKTLLITTSSFTSNAKNTAKKAPIELWDKSKLHNEVENTFL